MCVSTISTRKISNIMQLLASPAKRMAYEGQVNAVVGRKSTTFGDKHSGLPMGSEASSCWVGLNLSGSTI
jgi:hypothetical protein